MPQRSGESRRYGHASERRIFAQGWTNRPPGPYHLDRQLLAGALAEISDDAVWRVLSKQHQHPSGVCRQGRRYVGLYLSPPEHALVLSIDEEPSIQALERTQGWIRLPDGQAMNGFTHCYKRHGTTTLFAALDIVTGQARKASLCRYSRQLCDGGDHERRQERGLASAHYLQFLG